jgi:tetratricopeptide (TPR) repeat protein
MRRAVCLAVIASLSFAAEASAQPLRPQPSASASATAPVASPPAPGTIASALDAARTTDYARAERELLAIKGADTATAQLALARIMLEQGRFADAEKYAKQAEATTKKLEALAVRAQVLATTGRTADAIKLLDPHKDAAGIGGRRVRLLLGELLINTGKRSDGESVLMKFADEYGDDTINAQDAEGLAMVGRAMFFMRSAKDANKAFNESERVANGPSARVETLLWRAELFLDKWDTGHAEEVVKEALKIAPKRADALVMMARVKLDQMFDFDAAERLTKKALDVNPKHVGAYAVRAGLALRDMDIDAATAALTAGFAINADDLELWSMKAATRFLADDRAGYDAAKKEALNRNAQYSQFFTLVAEFAEWEHRYDDIVAMMKEAVGIDPKDGRAWAQLGLNQMHGGDEDEGVKSLETAWKYDKYNVRAFNTLERLYKQWIPTGYEMGTAGTYKIRYPKAEKAMLERYVPRMMGEAWGTMKIHYDFVPTTPIQVEMYSDRQHFSVRTSGLPSIGIQGVCFGRVVAAMSPHSEPFNWGNVIWHELGHVFAIQLSKNHVPRWFTEGLSEYETIVRRPEWQREMDPELYRVLVKNVLPGAVDMNRAFTHASDELDVTAAYYAASQMIVYTAERYGLASIAKALSMWGDGKRTADVIQGAFGVSAADYDKGFRDWAMNRLVRYKTQFMFDMHPKPLEDAEDAVKKNPQSAAAHVDLALALLRHKKLEPAKKELDLALGIDPNEKNAHYLYAKLAHIGKDTDGQLKHLQAIQRAGGDGYAIQIELADIAEAKKDKDTMRAALETAYKWDPTQSDALKGLYDLAHEDKREADELWALRKLAKLEQHDRQIWKLLLNRLVEKKLWDEARKVGEGAIYVDVESYEVHLGYAKALAALGYHEKAAFEAESATLCKAKEKEIAAAHALMAKELLANGDSAGAKAHRDEALKIDPDNADAKAMKIP